MFRRAHRKMATSCTCARVTLREENWDRAVDRQPGHRPGGLVEETAPLRDGNYRNIFWVTKYKIEKEWAD